MKVKVDSEDIATIRNALCIIQLNAETIADMLLGSKVDKIIQQVKRIDKLLPQVKFEGG